VGKRGPAPTPVKVLQLRGTYRKDRDAPNPVDPPRPAKPPSCPSWFGMDVEGERDVEWARYARSEYRRLSRKLLDLGLLTEVDRDALLAYCDAVGRWRYWRAELGRLGSWNQITESGYVAPRPEVSYMNKALEDMRRWGALFGLSPSDRRNVSATPKQEADTAADFLFGGRKRA